MPVYISMCYIKFEYFNHDVPVYTSSVINDEYLFIAFRGGYFGFKLIFYWLTKMLLIWGKYEVLFVNRKPRISARHKDQSQE